MDDVKRKSPGRPRMMLVLGAIAILAAAFLTLVLGVPSWADAPHNPVAGEFEAESHDSGDGDDAECRPVASARPAPRPATPAPSPQARALLAQLPSSAAPRAPPQR